MFQSDGKQFHCYIIAAQINLIQNVTFATIICDNVLNVQDIQVNPFLVPGPWVYQYYDVTCVNMDIVCRITGS